MIKEFDDVLPLCTVLMQALRALKSTFFVEVLHFVLFQRCEFLWIFDGCARAAYRQSEDGGEASGNPAKVKRRKSTKIRNIRKLGFRTFYKIIAWP